MKCGVLTLVGEILHIKVTAIIIVDFRCLKADGQNTDGTIRFKLWTDPDLLPLENRTASVRLSNGTDLYEGRLEVLIDDEWGTVCNEVRVIMELCMRICGLCLHVCGCISCVFF